MKPYTDEQFEQRFWSQVKKTDSCWIWTGKRVYNGYGAFFARINGLKYWRAHRYSWALVNGPIEDGLYVCHHCDKRLCVRPSHLWLGTHLENQRDMAAKNRQEQGARHHFNKFTESEVLEIFDDRETSHSELARRFDVHATSIAKIREGKSWRKLLSETGRIASVQKGLKT